MTKIAEERRTRGKRIGKGKGFKDRHPLIHIVADTASRNPGLCAGLLAAVAGSIGFMIGPPLVLERIVDGLTMDGRLDGLMILGYIGFLIASGLVDTAKEGMITLFGQRITRGIRTTMVEKMRRLPASYYAKNDQGVIVSRMVNDVDTVERLFTSGIISMVVDACKVISVLVVIWVKSKGLGLLVLLAVPPLFALTMVFQKRMLQAQMEHRAAVGKANHHVPETIENIRTIDTMHCEGYMKRVYGSYIEDGFTAMEKSNFYDAIYSPIIITTSSVLIAALMICAAMGGGMQTFFGMTAGTAVAVISYVGKVFEPLESIGMEIQNIQSAVAGVCRIDEFLQEPERRLHVEETKEAAQPAEASVPAIAFESVSFGYEPDHPILKNCSFQLENGANCTLTGRTGIGKSTILKLILGLYEPWEGEIMVYGIPVGRLSDEKRAAQIGYVEQSFQMIDGSVRDQITLKTPQLTEAQAKEALQLVGLWEVVQKLEQGIDTPCKEAAFSQGQLQLLSIARAVAADPPILLLDEITANLDSVTESRVLEALERASENRTVLSISHRTSSKQDHTSQNTICFS